MAYSWTYGGIRAETLFLQTSHVRRDILPPVNARTVPIPGRAGNQFVQADYEMRTITIDVFINADTMIISENYVRDIAEFLDSTDGLRALIFDDNPNLQYQAIVSGATDISQILELKRGQITFLVPDVYAMGTTPINLPFHSIVNSRFSTATRQYRTDLDDPHVEDFDNSGHATLNPFFPTPDPTKVTQILSDVPRYQEVVYDNFPSPEIITHTGLLVEQGTTNLCGQNAALAMSDNAQFVKVGCTMGSENEEGMFRSFIHNVNMAAGSVILPGTVASEGIYHEVTTGITAGTTYTFSFYLRHGLPYSIFPEIVYLTAGGAVISSALGLGIVGTAEWERRSFTFTTPATTGRVRLTLRTAGAHAAGTFLINCWQLEQKAYMTSWMYGVGSSSGNVRQDEDARVEVEGMLTTGGITASGTIQFMFSPFSTPTSFGALFDWGEFSGGNTIPRIAILHGTSVGTSRRTFQMQITNGATTTTHFLNVTQAAASKQGDMYYVCARWNLTGNIGTGYVKLFVYNFQSNEQLATTTATAMTPISFASYGDAYIGSNYLGNANHANATFTDIRFDKSALPDSFITTLLTTIKTIDNPLEVKQADAFRYPLDHDRCPTLYLPQGNVNTQKGTLLWSYTAGDQVKLFNVNSGKFLSVTFTGFYNLFDWVHNTLETGDTIPFLAIEMPSLSFDSQFFPLLLKKEMTFYVTSNDLAFPDMDLKASISGEFEYYPRYL